MFVARAAVVLTILACVGFLVDIYVGHDPLHIVAVNAFGPLAFLVPIGIAIFAYDMHRRHDGREPWLRFEESCGAVLLFVSALTLASLTGLSYSLVGNSLSDEVSGVVGHAGTLLVMLVLLFLALSLVLHLTVDGVVGAVLTAARGAAKVGGAGKQMVEQQQAKRAARRVPQPLTPGAARASSPSHSLRDRMRRREELDADGAGHLSLVSLHDEDTLEMEQAPSDPRVHSAATAPREAVRPAGSAAFKPAPGGAAGIRHILSSSSVLEPTGPEISLPDPSLPGPDLASTVLRFVPGKRKGSRGRDVESSEGRQHSSAGQEMPVSNGDMVLEGTGSAKGSEKAAGRRTAVAPAAPLVPGVVVPPLSLLDAVPEALAAPSDNDLRARIIEETLNSFNVVAVVVEVQSGPTVTQFGLRPAPGVRVQRITALANDLALALAAPSIRIEAPVPGKPMVGIEIPNSQTALVTLREILESNACARMTSPLRVALGKNVSGESVVVDLARMPHLLIAGATGSGKSVCLNSLIACLLFHNTPAQVRLLMIDPKMVELTTFNGVPHLLHPVVTEMDKVSGTLKWVLKEMHRRYKLFGEASVRNLARYNELQAEKAARGEVQTGKNLPLPHIVFIIDELADLMMVSPAEVEDSISRLAALARATGIHLVLATQRPSVDVITGVIKANFPARIAFAVSSQVDSRTILDQGGAEKLLGRGDMLYLPSDGSKAMRVQGAYLSDQEIERLVEYWKEKAEDSGPPLQSIAPAELEAPPEAASENEGDEKLLVEASKVVREYNRASVSLLQRRLSIGYSRAARLLDLLEDRGVVGASEDGRSRIVLDLHDDPRETAVESDI